MRGTLLATVVAAVACLSAARGACAQVVISIEGSCPTHLTFRWEGATPNRTGAIAFGTERGIYVLPAWCQGTALGLGPRGLRLAAHAPTGPEGSGSLTRRATAFACGGYLQMIVDDAAPCTTSNVVQVPQ